MSTKTTPRVSVIIRTKDRPTLLARALDDVLAQDYSAWELVVMNDGGDSSVVDGLVIARPGFGDRVRVIHHATSLGMEAASNAGVQATTAELLVVHDDDDTWAPDFLSAGVAWLDAHPSDVAVSLGTEIVLERIDGTSVVEIDRVPFGPPHDTVTAFDLLVANRFVPISLLLRRSALDEVGGFDESLDVVGDWDVHVRLALHGHIGYAPSPIRAFWHQRPDAEGDLVNSVHGAQNAHARFDRIVRDRALREYASEHGIGGLLYLSKFIDERIAADERHTYEKIQDAIEAHRADMTQLEKRISQTVEYYSFGQTLRRGVRRLLGRRP